MIQTTLGALAEASKGLAAVMALQLPTVTAYRLSKLGKRVFAETKDFYDQRNAAVRRLGVHIDGTDQFRFDGPNKDVFTDEMKALAEIEVKIDAAPIALSALDGRDVAAEHLLALENAALLVDDIKDA